MKEQQDRYVAVVEKHACWC